MALRPQPSAIVRKLLRELFFRHPLDRESSGIGQEEESSGAGEIGQDNQDHKAPHRVLKWILVVVTNGSCFKPIKAAKWVRDLGMTRPDLTNT
jgi:hypothetical protein